MCLKPIHVSVIIPQYMFSLCNALQLIFNGLTEKLDQEPWGDHKVTFAPCPETITQPN